MAKKGMKLGLALAAGAGAAAVLAKTTSKEHKAPAPVSNSDYRNTERGKYEKTAKESITAMETTKPLPVRKSRKALTIKMPTL